MHVWEKKIRWIAPFIDEKKKNWKRNVLNFEMIGEEKGRGWRFWEGIDHGKGKEDLSIRKGKEDPWKTGDIFGRGYFFFPFFLFYFIFYFIIILFLFCLSFSNHGLIPLWYEIFSQKSIYKGRVYIFFLILKGSKEFKPYSYLAYSINYKYKYNSTNYN